ncbi:peptide-methionine (S)-S-oxide reductase [Kytococcus schroeteri]|uniref:peptide-methionine (S)-S-oxide reductase n=1 Tax=Kytococcus schroeteri TaxID=138300 RepID=UPI0015DF4618
MSSAESPTEEVHLAGGCLWGVQAFLDTLPGVVWTEAGRANGAADHLDGPYDGYAECVRVRFDPRATDIERLLGHLFEIIDPYAVNQQGPDVGEKYRTGVYSRDPRHLEAARAWLAARPDADRVAVEVRLLTRWVRSAEEHQKRLARCPDDACHLPPEVLYRHRT